MPFYEQNTRYIRCLKCRLTFSMALNKNLKKDLNKQKSTTGVCERKSNTRVSNFPIKRPQIVCN